MEKSADAFRTISEVAEDLRLPQHVLRFWETRFPQIRPLKRAGGRRYYRPADTVLLRTIRQLLYEEGYTIKGVQRLLKEQGVKRLSGEGLSFVAGPSSVDRDGLGAFEVEAEGVDASADAAWDDGGREAGTPTGSSAAPMPVLPPPVVPGPRAAVPDHHGALREALTIVEDCLAILRAVR